VVLVNDQHHRRYFDDRDSHGEGLPDRPVVPIHSADDKGRHTTVHPLPKQEIVDLIISASTMQEGALTQLLCPVWPLKLERSIDI
jgi:hypothetical protein